MMNNQMALMMRRQMINNPQQFAQNALRSGRFNNNPMYKNAVEAIANNDTESMQKITDNLCKEHNVSVDDAQKQFKQYYGIN